MVKLDVSLMRFMEDEDYRVLIALEMTMRNHDVAPTTLVERIAQLPHGGCRKRLNHLLKHKIIHHENTMYDGYAMKYQGYDMLAMRTFCKRGTVVGVGTRIGCGKESDIILVQDESGNDCVMKLQRLGRCSFRSVVRNRDYKGGMKKRHGESWFYLSRLASQKEYAFMQMLYDEGFPVPKPIDQNRHALLMEYIDGTLLNNIQAMNQAQKVYEQCVGLIVKFAEHGLIHGDFNEFNILVTDEYRVIIIDFPQMISTDHPNATELFDRDIKNLADFFQRRFRIATALYPKLDANVERLANLDRQAFASGHFTRNQEKELQRMLAAEMAQEGTSESDGEENDNEEGETEVAMGREQHTDPTSDDLVGRTTGEGVCPSDSAHEDEESEASENVEHWDREIAASRQDRQQQKQRADPNRTRKGKLKEEYIAGRVKKNLVRKDNQEFYHTLGRNAQKGRAKKKIQRQLKQGSHDFGLYDD